MKYIKMASNKNVQNLAPRNQYKLYNKFVIGFHNFGIYGLRRLIKSLFRFKILSASYLRVKNSM